MVVRIGDAGLSGLAQHRADACMGVLDERPRIAVEVDGFARVEKHGLLGVNLENEVFECPESHHAADVGGLFGGGVVQLAQFARHLHGGRYHIFNQVVGIHDRSFARLHFSFGQFHHAVGEVEDVVAPCLVAELFQYEFEDLEVVILLVAHHVDEFVEAVVLETAVGRAEVLRHVDRGAVAAQQQLFVQPVGGEVYPHRVVGTAVEDPFAESLFHQLLAQQVGLRFVIGLVEVDAQRGVGFVEAVVHPAVHGLPQGIGFRLFRLPAAQHLLRLAHDGSIALRLFLALALCDELSDLLLVVAVEFHVVFSYQMVALHAARGGRFPTAELLPCQHAFADVDAAVVHEVGLDDPVAARLQNLRYRITEQVVADVPQVEGLVGVGR